MSTVKRWIEDHGVKMTSAMNIANDLNVWDMNFKRDITL